VVKAIVEVLRGGNDPTVLFMNTHKRDIRNTLKKRKGSRKRGKRGREESTL